MKFWKLTSIVMFLVLSTSSQAALISLDWNNTDDNLITHDTVTGLNWLDLTETRGMTYETVTSQFNGWRYATTAEVVNLWANFNVNLSSSSVFNNASIVEQGVYDAALILGDTEVLAQAGYPYSGTRGITAENDAIGAWVSNDPNYGVYTIHWYDGFSSQSPGSDYFGSYLVEVSAVPVPAAVWLFGSGLIGLVGFARRKKA